MALVRDPRAAVPLADTGATIVVGDLTDAGGRWAGEVEGVAGVVHAGLPRMPAPARTRPLSAASRAAASAARNLAAAVGPDVPLVVVSGHQVYGNRAGPVTEDEAPEPLGFGRVQRAAEEAAAGARTRVVRLGWVYGDRGFAPGIVSAAVGRRLRIVGSGENPVPVISAHDAATALVAALDAEPGVYNVAEAAPTQKELVRGVCAAAGVRGPDSLPVLVASLSLGRGMAEALAAACEMRSARTGLRWSVSADWRQDLVRRAGVPLPAPGGR